MLTADQTTEVAELFRLLGEPNRLRIVGSCVDRTLSVGKSRRVWRKANRWFRATCACSALLGCSRPDGGASRSTTASLANMCGRC
jgi:hypothetical protein